MFVIVFRATSAALLANAPPLADVAEGLLGSPFLIVGVVVGVLALGLLAYLVFRRRSIQPADVGDDLVIDVASLDDHGPSDVAPTLEFRGVPVRLAVLVLAPVGKNGILPSRTLLPEVMDSFLPGFMEVLDRNKPLFRRWPKQLSVQGFIQAFGNDVALPGDRGKGTPWCSAAGRFEHAGVGYLIGVVGCGDKPNGLTHEKIANEGGWRDVLRIRR